jgi:hypothetical protein
MNNVLYYFNGVFKQFKRLNNCKNVENVNLLGNLIIYALIYNEMLNF